MYSKMTSWWIVWEDLKWPDDDVYKKIIRRADLMLESHVDAAIVFGAHFRWDFMPIWDCLHDYMRTVASELHKRNIKFLDHHSATLTHRHSTREGMREVKINSGPHLPFSPSYTAAKSWALDGKLLNDWRMIDITTSKPLYLPRYTAEQFCFNNPDFINAYQKYLKLLLEETELDGLMCDDAIYFSGFNVCACKYCRLKFKNIYGYDIPGYENRNFWGNWENKKWKDWIAFRFASNGDFLEKIKKSLPEKFPLTSCCSGSYGGSSNHSAQDVRQFTRGVNIVHLELCGNTPSTNDPLTINKSIAEKLALSSHHLAQAKKLGLKCIGQGFGFSEASGNIIWALNKMLGSGCCFSTLKGRLGLADSQMTHLPDDPEIMAKAFSFEHLHDELFESEVLSQVGVYFSYNTRNNTFFGDIKNGYETDYKDTITSLFDAGIPTGTVFDIPENTKEYEVLLLPSVLCLSDNERASLERYLSLGGKVIATGPCGLYDENGNPSTCKFLSKYGVDVIFEEPEGPKNFWEDNWQSTIKSEPCRNQSKWHELDHDLFWHPRRLQDSNPPDILEILRRFSLTRPIEIDSAQGYLSSLHYSKSNPDVYILHLLAGDYDVEVDEEIELKRKHRSRVNLITAVRAKNVTSEVKLHFNIKVKDIEVFTPFQEKSSKVNIEKNLSSIFLPENSSYVIVKILTESPAPPEAF